MKTAIKPTVGAPDPELRNSPDHRRMGQRGAVAGHRARKRRCYFNTSGLSSGEYAHSGDGAAALTGAG